MGKQKVLIDILRPKSGDKEGSATLVLCISLGSLEVA
jgi:hypothetical protein